MVMTATRARVTPAAAYKIAWALAAIFYFLEYVSRSAPAVMIPELKSAFQVDAVGISAIIGSYYYTYSVMSLVAGATLDRLGAKASVPLGAVVLGLGCVIFIAPVPIEGEIGRLLQGAGSAFAFTGAVFLAAHGFKGAVLATAIGFTQCFGMLGGSAGQVVVGPLIHGLLDWKGFWIACASACFATAVALFVATPTKPKDGEATSGILEPFKVVFRNPQSYLCGAIAGLLFAPTTVGDMIWGVAFFQQDKRFDFGDAVSVASMVPLGWALGCPILGWFADYIGRRKVALALGAIVMLSAVLVIATAPNHFTNYVGMLALGIGSGAAMIPYTVIKEVNPDNVKGSAIGVINFITFGVTAAIGPLFAKRIGRSLSTNTDPIEHFRQAAWFWAFTIALAIILNFFLRETGLAAKKGWAEHSDAS